MPEQRYSANDLRKDESDLNDHGIEPGSLHSKSNALSIELSRPLLKILTGKVS
jgi:hypothetical protein